MDNLFQFLKDLLPLQIAALIVIFIYFLKVFKDIASEFTKISHQQAEYMRQRVESLDHTTSIYERTVQHQEKDLKRLYEANEKMKEELIASKGHAVDRLDEQLNEIVRSIEQIKKDKLSKEEFDELKTSVEKAKQNTSKRYDAAIQSLSEANKKNKFVPKALRSVFISWSFGLDKTEVFDCICKILNEKGITAKYSYDADNEHHDIAFNVRAIIDECDVMIADISGHNPNVMYELGYAHGSGKDVILLTSEKHFIPFDISNYKVIWYKNSPDGIEALKENLSVVIDNLKKNYKAQIGKEVLEVLFESVPYIANISSNLIRWYL